MEKKKVRRYTRREVRRNRMIAFCCLVVLAILLIALIVWGIKNLVSGDDGKSSSESSLGTVSTSQSSSPDNASNSDSSLSEAAASGGDSSADESASGASGSSSSSKVSSGTSTSSINSSDPYYESSMPLLVNPDHLMPDDYSPTVVSVGGNYKLESKAAAAWQDMQAAASRDGVPLWIISAYRTLERQTELYQEKVEEYKNLGYNEGDAKIEAGKWVAVPGTSEHCLGYAADLCSLEENFENSDQFAWLQKHCAEYGFILRYPKDKVDITKISYEPWHYRYVGSNHAQIIMSQGLCLEEYLEQYSS
ncbi:MAG: M15 family metallopeptidase [Oscillospiraceae bacterium]|nr:M15 family metallopeptidase [Oscillospiraceae bacterium]MDD7042035.1 M15 family metallopeptidase [Oscillospiraceae bacterium]MDY2612267.1 M15 family metallopeptidase [Oscillospiraceae bacterium]